MQVEGEGHDEAIIGTLDVHAVKAMKGEVLIGISSAIIQKANPVQEVPVDLPASNIPVQMYSPRLKWLTKVQCNAHQAFSAIFFTGIRC